MKICNKCKEEKELSEFNDSKTTKDKLRSECKICFLKNQRNRRRTKEGKLKTIYDHQVQHSKTRGYEPPNYTKQEFVDRFIDNLDYIRHYYSWVISNYSTKYSPSFDRLDDYKPYSFDNMQIMYWCQNKAKGHSDMKNGILNKQSKAVVGIHIKTGETIEFYSGMDAERNGFNQSNVGYCCRGERKTHKGYKWEYKNK